MAEALTLYDYWRSSSAYRVRIALNLKGLEYRQVPVHLVRDGGQQNSPSYRQINPLGLVPALAHGEQVVVQSLAICEYLEESFDARPLLPVGPAERARVRGLVQTVCSEVQPLNNLSVMQFLKGELATSDEDYRRWYGDIPGLADCFLVPQVYNAERFNCDLGPYPRIREVTARCRGLEAFAKAAPEQQSDAE
jgi:maleylacetoacetate isomerase